MSSPSCGSSTSTTTRRARRATRRRRSSAVSPTCASLVPPHPLPPSSRSRQPCRPPSLKLHSLTRSSPCSGIAISGGGLRASLYGAGTLSALDGRNSSTAGPLLQLASYLAGLSGGSWTVTSVALNDLEPIYSLVTGANSSRTGGWQLDRDILAPSGLLGFSDNSNYYSALEDDVRAKAAAGFPISVTDLWGRALAYHFLNGTNEDNFFSTDAAHDQGTLFSSIRYTSSFQAGQMPYPILATTSRINENQQLTNDSTSVIPLENTGFEISPYTFGSFEATLAAYIPLEYLGTQLSNGQPTNRCVNYFDNAGFAMGVRPSSLSLTRSLTSRGSG